MTENPTIYVIAGPNGVGKTSSANFYFPDGLNLVNADEIAKQLREQYPYLSNVQELANEQAMQKVNIFLSKKESFGFETNLADNETWKFLESVQFLGYQVVINFFCVESVEICIKRIDNRVVEGGHFVRSDIVKGRYNSGLKLLYHYYKMPDLLLLTDTTEQNPTTFLVLEKGEIIVKKDNLPNWIQTFLTYKNQKENVSDSADQSLDDIRNKYKNLKKD
jgi:predicted ABC-type ATPase